MSLISSISFVGFINTSAKAKHDKIRQGIKPIAFVLKRQQPFSTTTPRALPNKTSYRQHHRVETNTGPVTEKSVLDNFPRPNLMPTLHSSLFGSPPTQKQTYCSNCSGPHSTEFCPC
ncbi:hypothetical protein BY458DRAFT_506276 [Sporodiniella umbellata]|nr:hypothetical protein BY458DRAFT_506276 [Sporodiniella umbellata]